MINMLTYCVVTKDENGKFINVLELRPLKDKMWMWTWFDEQKNIERIETKKQNPFLTSDKQKMKNFVYQTFGVGFYQVHIPRGVGKGTTIILTVDFKDEFFDKEEFDEYIDDLEQNSNDDEND